MRAVSGSGGQGRSRAISALYCVRRLGQAVLGVDFPVSDPNQQGLQTDRGDSVHRRTTTRSRNVAGMWVPAFSNSLAEDCSSHGLEPPLVVVQHFMAWCSSESLMSVMVCICHMSVHIRPGGAAVPDTYRHPVLLAQAILVRTASRLCSLVFTLQRLVWTQGGTDMEWPVWPALCSVLQQPLFQRQTHLPVHLAAHCTQV